MIAVDFWASPEGKKLLDEYYAKRTPEQAEIDNAINAVKKMDIPELVEKLATGYAPMNRDLRDTLARALFSKIKTSICFRHGDTTIEMIAERVFYTVRRERKVYYTFLRLWVYEGGEFSHSWGMTFDTSYSKSLE